MPLNPVPAYALLIGVVLLVAGLVRRNREVQVLALWIMAVAGLVALPTWPLEAADAARVTPSSRLADETGREGRTLLTAFQLTAALALAAMLMPSRFARAIRVLTLVCLTAAGFCVGAAFWMEQAKPAPASWPVQTHSTPPGDGLSRESSFQRTSLP